MNVALADNEFSSLDVVVDYDGLFASQIAAIRMGLIEHNFHLLQYVNPYGDTVFNSLQMPHVLEDLEALATTANPVVQRMLGEMRDLALQCQTGIHLYLMFIGD